MKTKSARKLEYWLERGYSKEDGERMRRSKIPGTIEYFEIFKKYPPDVAKRKRKEFWDDKAFTLKNQIKKFGNEEGTRRFNEYRAKQAYSNSFEYKQNKYGWTKEEFEDFNKSRAVTEENLILKHGESKGKCVYKKYQERQRYAGCKLEYFVEKLGKEKGVEEYNRIGILKSHTFNSFLMRSNGDIETANKKYNEYLKTSNIKAPVSNISQELFNSLYFRLKDDFEQIYYADLNQEWILREKGGNAIFLDFFVRDIGKVIEFNGDYWHANPEMYKNVKFINYPGNKQQLVSEIWEKDKKRLDKIKKMPYTKGVLIIWEFEYLNDPNGTINKCLEFLKNE